MLLAAQESMTEVNEKTGSTSNKKGKGKGRKWA